MEEKNLKPSEKLSALEKSSMLTARRVGELEMLTFSLSRENDILKDALQLLHDKLNAVTSLIAEGHQLNDENINQKITQMKEADLKDKVDKLVEQGTIAASNQVSDRSVVVARELSKDGKVENPRLQFIVSPLAEELKQKFLGKVVGELIKGDGDKLDVEIMEIYDIVEKKQEEPSNAEEAQAAQA